MPQVGPIQCTLERLVLEECTLPKVERGVVEEYTQSRVEREELEECIQHIFAQRVVVERPRRAQLDMLEERLFRLLVFFRIGPLPMVALLR